MKEKSPLFQRTIAFIKMIPNGRVVTYGGIADSIGAPGCGRHVSYILSSSSRKYHLPWHRVIGSSGKISTHKYQTRQARLLKKEGVTVEGSSIDLKLFLWKPAKKEVNAILKGIPKHISIYARPTKKRTHLKKL